MKTRYIIPLLFLLCCTAGCSGVSGDHSIEQATPAASANGHTDQTTLSELDIFADAVLNPNLYDDGYLVAVLEFVTVGTDFSAFLSGSVKGGDAPSSSHFPGTLFHQRFTDFWYTFKLANTLTNNRRKPQRKTQVDLSRQ